MDSNNISGFIETKRYNVDDTYYTFVHIQMSNYHKAIPEMFQHFQNLLKGHDIETGIDLNNKTISIKDSKEAIKIISTQPDN